MVSIIIDWTSSEMVGNHAKSTETNGTQRNPWRAMKSNGNHHKWLKIIEHQQKLTGISEKQQKPTGINSKHLKSMGINRKHWQPLEINRN